jgi:hypothetical protein
MRMLRALALASSLSLASVSAWAQSTINTSVPGFGNPLSSAPIQGNFLAASTDINGIITGHAGNSGPATPYLFEDFLNTGATPYIWHKYVNSTVGYTTIGTINPSTGVYVVNPGSVPINTSLILSGGLVGINLANSNTFTAPQAISLSAAPLQTAQTGTMLQLAQADGVTARIELDSYAAVSRFSCLRADGTNASKTALLSGDEVCSLNIFGYNGTAFVGPQAAIRSYAAQNWSVGANGSYLRFGVTANGSSTLTDAMGIEQNGGITVGTVVGTSAGVGTINVSGNYYVSGAIAATTVNGQSCALGGACTITASAGTITSGVTTVASSTTGYVLYDNAGILGSYPITGSGNVVLSASPTFTGTPVLSTPTATSLALGGATLGGNALAVTGTVLFNSAINYGGVALSNSVTGTGSMVLSAGATLTGTTTVATLAATTINGAALSGTFSGTPIFSGANFVTLANIVQTTTAWSILGNATSGTANYAAFTIPGLTAKSTPVGADQTMIADSAASGALKVVTLTQLLGSITSGISSIDTQTGAFTSGNGIDTVGKVIELTAARRTLPTVCVIVLTSATTCANGGSQANNGTYTTPANVLWIEVEVDGGGGGGGGGGSGSNSGVSGTASTFGSSLLTASGGVTGLGATAAGGSGGGGAGGYQNWSGGNGGNGFAAAATISSPGGNGGNNPCHAGGGASGTGAVAAGSAVPNTGGGGGGGTAVISGQISGGGGGAGGCVRAIINSPSATYTYAVGPGGSGGSIGGGSQAGGNGAAGIIIITEHYNSLLFVFVAFIPARRRRAANDNREAATAAA